MGSDWLIVSGGVHRRGGQDRANLELVRYLSLQGVSRVYIVTHEVAPEVGAFRNVEVDVVPRPFGSILLGERLLEAVASRRHSKMGARTIIIANGGNYPRATINWVHSVHAVWPVRDEGAPVRRRIFNRVKKWDARIRERRALRTAHLLIANSPRTARDVMTVLGVPAERIVTIPFGSDARSLPDEAGPFAMRLAFVGALGWDRNKGLDIALQTLRLLIQKGHQRASLVVAGAGALTPWQRMTRELEIEGRVTFLGMIDDVPALLRSVDLLVSPVRYEAYGLAIHEALLAGVPPLVSASAGIAASIEAVLPDLIVREQEEPKAWVASIERVARDIDQVRRGVARLGSMLAQRSWEQMASDIVRTVLRRGL